MKRQIVLDIWHYRFPPMAICSILHRITGMVIFLSLPWLLYLLYQSLHTATSFAALQDSVGHQFWMSFFLWVVLSALSFHCLAGIRHMIMDMGYGESLVAGRRSALWVLALFVVAIIVLGIVLW